ncbi:MAG: hypothetical protein DWP97_14090 [Calditrichaeota bacterium]|nr:MAG: hypothetical protein DWP97_14090 [Calditrichota bacterium]
MKVKIQYIGLTLFMISLSVFTLFSFFPSGRVWGFNIWAYMSNVVPIGIVVSALLLALFVNFYADRLYFSFTKKMFIISTVVTSFLFFGSFLLLRVRTLFLGDGYTILSLLSSGNPLIEKKRQLLESYSHIYLYKLIGAGGLSDALFTYQLISWFAGLLFIGVALYASVKMFESYIEKLLFFLGLISSGFIFLFFGYVEHYSLFALTMLICTVVSVLILKDNLSRWIIVPLTLLACLTHIFGVSLIPPMIYILFMNTKLETLFNKQNAIRKSIILGVPVILFTVLVVYYYKSDYFFQISLVPIVENRLTQEGYTLFSISHLLDMLNLLFLLIPGFLILAISVLFSKPKRIFSQKIYQLALITVLSTFGLAFIFDPKLGMPRDWDLFAFWGIPLSFFLYYFVIKQFKQKAVVHVLLSVILGFSILIPRAYSFTQDDTAITHFRNYLYLDKVKNRNSWILLENYYKEKDDSLKTDEVHTEWKSNFPEEVMMKQANDLLFNQRNPNAAMRLLYDILEVNPTYPDAYAFLGFYYLQTQQYDSAITLLRLSDALSPNRANNIDNLGRAYHSKKDYSNAMKYYQLSNYLDSANYIYKYNIARLYQELGDMENYHNYLKKSASLDGSLDLIKKELIQSHLRRSEIAEVKMIIQNNESLKQDTLFINKLESLLGIKF